MIHQCYFAPEHLKNTFRDEPYRPFGLEPEVNAEITNNCPELASEDTRMALAEYGAMLHHWRNPTLDSDPWIGFTSYRQLTKSPFKFSKRSEVELLLNRGDFVTWYAWWVAPAKFGPLRGAAAQAEANHPGIHQFMVDVLNLRGLTIPAGYETAPLVSYANYWAMPRSRFDAFMEWSWPIIADALAMDHPYLSTPSRPGSRDNKRRAIGYFMERIFILWALHARLRVVAVGPLFGVDGRPVDSPTLARINATLNSTPMRD
jgi:hypothetical protein